MDLVRRLRQTRVFGLTFPLVTTAAGEKFGKTADNAMWLDRAKTSPWDLYQYLTRQDDRDVIRFLKLYTHLEAKEIARLDQASASAPEQRVAQRALAFEVTRLVHGDRIANEVREAADTVYYSPIRSMSDEVLSAAFATAPATAVTREEVSRGLPIVDLLMRTRVSESRSHAARLLRAGGVYVNNSRVDEALIVTSEHLASPTLIVLRTGKKHYHLVRVIEV